MLMESIAERVEDALNRSAVIAIGDEASLTETTGSRLFRRIYSCKNEQHERSVKLRSTQDMK